MTTNADILTEIRELRQEVRHLRRLFQPAYIVLYQDINKEAYEELKDKVCKPMKPGQIIPLSPAAFDLYKKMLPCPPPRR